MDLLGSRFHGNDYLAVHNHRFKKLTLKMKMPKLNTEKLSGIRPRSPFGYRPLDHIRPRKARVERAGIAAHSEGGLHVAKRSYVRAQGKKGRL